MFNILSIILAILSSDVQSSTDAKTDCRTKGKLNKKIGNVDAIIEVFHLNIVVIGRNFLGSEKSLKAFFPSTYHKGQ